MPDNEDLFTFETEPAAAAPKAPRAAKGGTPRITSGWGDSRDGGKRSHHATDYAFAEGDPLSVNRGGRVTRIGEDSRAGKHLFIDHGNGYVSSYSHLSSIDVGEGDEIEPGDIFGRAGNTGHSTGPHVHQVVRKGGARVNPQETDIRPVRGERPFERSYLQFETTDGQEEPNSVFDFETTSATPPTAGHSALPPGHLTAASDASPAAASPTGQKPGSRPTSTLDAWAQSPASEVDAQADDLVGQAVSDAAAGQGKLPPRARAARPRHAGGETRHLPRR
jgi:hypothetical protein